MTTAISESKIQEADFNAEAGPRPLRWTKEQYYDMARLGWFENKRVELLDGEIVEMAALLGPHATAVSLARFELDRVFGKTHYVRVQMPLDLNRFFQPEPDIAVVMGGVRDYKNVHPQTAILAVEISHATLRYDLGEKANLYAQAGIADYWVIDVENRRVWIHREPQNGLYSNIQTLRENKAVSPLAAPDASIKISDLLP